MTTPAIQIGWENSHWNSRFLSKWKNETYAFFWFDKNVNTSGVRFDRNSSVWNLGNRYFHINTIGRLKLKNWNRFCVVIITFNRKLKFDIRRKTKIVRLDDKNIVVQLFFCLEKPLKFVDSSIKEEKRTTTFCPLIGKIFGNCCEFILINFIDVVIRPFSAGKMTVASLNRNETKSISSFRRVVNELKLNRLTFVTEKKIFELKRLNNNSTFLISIRKIVVTSRNVMKNANWIGRNETRSKIEIRRCVEKLRIGV